MKKLWTICLLTAAPLACAQSTHYLDCGRTDGGGDSLQPGTAWSSLEQANHAEFKPGDRLLLRRGSRCQGMLAPQGSGSATAPIHLDAYGEGALPVIDAAKQKAGLELVDQSDWEIANLEIAGGSPYGLHIAASHSSVHHLRLHNLVIHGVTGEPTEKESGLLIVAPLANSTATVDDVLVDGVTVFDTTQWAGMLISGASFSDKQRRFGEHIVVRNSIVHDVAGDGILLANTRHGLLEHNVAWNTGMQETETIGTPNAIWEWMCEDCRVAWNEGFFSDSPGVDGGVFDIDFGNRDNVVEHNFGHDSQGYCVAIFGAEGNSGDSINSIVRNNVCLHNGRSPRLARRQGAIFLYTWHHGRLNGINVENNTIVWEPPLDAAAIHGNAELFGELPNRIANNKVLLASGHALQLSAGIAAESNQVCGPPADPQAANAFDTCWQQGQQALNTSQAYGVALDSRLARMGQGWRLATTIAQQESDTASRSRVVLLESMVQQFGALGLHGVLLPEATFTPTDAVQLRADWHLSPRIELAPFASRSGETAGWELLDPAGTVRAVWPASADAASLWIELQQQLGTPPGMQALPRLGSKR
jgi:hypothetical protein